MEELKQNDGTFERTKIYTIENGIHTIYNCSDILAWAGDICYLQVVELDKDCNIISDRGFYSFEIPIDLRIFEAYLNS